MKCFLIGIGSFLAQDKPTAIEFYNFMKTEARLRSKKRAKSSFLTHIESIRSLFRKAMLPIPDPIAHNKWLDSKLIYSTVLPVKTIVSYFEMRSELPSMRVRCRRVVNSWERD